MGEEGGRGLVSLWSTIHQLQRYPESWSQCANLAKGERHDPNTQEGALHSTGYRGDDVDHHGGQRTMGSLSVEKSAAHRRWQGRSECANAAHALRQARSLRLLDAGGC